MPLRPYPTEIPQEAIQMVWDVVRGQQPRTATVIHAGYEVLGYAAGKLYPDPMVVGTVLAPDHSFPPLEAQDESAVDHAFAHAIAESQSAYAVREAGVSGLMWSLIVRAILAMLQRRN